jgi:hypothetical protein
MDGMVDPADMTGMDGMVDPADMGGMDGMVDPTDPTNPDMTNPDPPAMGLAAHPGMGKGCEAGFFGGYGEYPEEFGMILNFEENEADPPGEFEINGVDNIQALIADAVMYALDMQ